MSPGPIAPWRGEDAPQGAELASRLALVARLERERSRQAAEREAVALAGWIEGARGLLAEQGALAPGAALEFAARLGEGALREGASDLSGLGDACAALCKAGADPGARGESGLSPMALAHRLPIDWMMGPHWKRSLAWGMAEGDARFAGELREAEAARAERWRERPPGMLLVGEGAMFDPLFGALWAQSERAARRALALGADAGARDLGDRAAWRLALRVARSMQGEGSGGFAALAVEMAGLANALRWAAEEGGAGDGALAAAIERGRIGEALGEADGAAERSGRGKAL